MFSNPVQSDPLSRLLKISSTLINDESLLNELMQEIKDGSSGPICSMFKSIFKRKLLEDLPEMTEFMKFFFESKSITEFPIFSSNNLGVKCFFMPKNSIFPLHDHKNKAVITGVLFGRIKYMTLDRTEDNWYHLSSKGTAEASKILFATRDYRNIHSLVAAENSVILDIFMPNDDDFEDFSIFHVLRKRDREFQLKQTTFTPHRRPEAEKSCLD
jgi:hypothetical protein